MSERAKPKTVYTSEQKAAALVALEMNGNRTYPLTITAKELDIPIERVSDWNQGRKLKGAEVYPLRDQIREGVLEQTERLRSLILGKAIEAIEQERINFRDLMGGLKITTEVSQLLSSQPTSITEARQSADEQRREIAEQAVTAIMAHKQLERADAIEYLRERQPTLAQFAREAA